MYPRLQATAHRLLSKYGAPRTIVLRTAQAAGSKPWLPGSTTVENEVTGVVLPVNDRTLESMDVRYGSDLIKDNVRMVVLSPEIASVPKPGDRLLFDEAIWSVIGVTPVSPGGIPLVYKVAVTS